MTYPNSGTTIPTGTGTSTGTSVGSSSVDQTTGKAHGYVDRLAQGAHDTVEKVASRSTQVGESVRTMRDSLQARAEHLIDARGELIESARGYVRERPFTALLAAALVGVLVANMLRGR
jgi:ElaB/YqjD/DUF883 family membrane-anchored ribosome-binding protein